MKFYQLKHLLWKNVLLRMSQKIWLLVEILIPFLVMLLFPLIKGGVDSYEKVKPTCYTVNPHALPSAGVLPFLQSLSCDSPRREYNGQTCKRKPGNDSNIWFPKHSEDGTRPLAHSVFVDTVLQTVAQSATILPSPEDDIRLLLRLFRNLLDSENTMNSAGVACGRTSGYYATDYEAVAQNFRPPESVQGKFFNMFGISKENFTTNATSVQCGHVRVDMASLRECSRTYGMPFAGLGSQSIQFCPLLMGRIVVSPDTTATRKVIQILADGLNRWKQLSILLKNYIDSADALQNDFSQLSRSDAVVKLAELVNGDTSFVESMLPEPELFEGGKMTLTRWKWLLREFSKILQYFNFDSRFVFASNRDDAIALSSCLQDYYQFIAHIDFDGDFDSEDLPNLSRYKIRMSNLLIDSTEDIATSSWDYSSSYKSSYLYLGFTYLQDWLSSAIVQAHTGEIPQVGAFLQQFPYPCYKSRSTVNDIIAFMLPPLLIFSWCFFAAMIIKNVTYEKEKGLKEFMKVMGLSTLSHWLSWFIQCFIILLLSVLLLVIILKVGNVFPATDSSALLVLFLLFGIATITQCFMISTWFSSANKAAVIGAMLYFMAAIPAMIYPAQSTLGIGKKFYSCLISQVSLGWAIKHITSWEQEGSGLQWSNMHRGPTIVERLTFWNILGMLVVDAVLYMIVALYFEAVWPGEFGIPKRWYFLITKEFWSDVCGCKPQPKDSERQMSIRRQQSEQRRTDNLEPEPENFPLGVTLQDLRKVYDNGNVAVDGLTLNFYESQITSFLGHNGAGKTTTMSILTGLFPPSGGHARVYGLDVGTQIDQIRKTMGMCPQHNVLYDKLTVKQQIWFYAGLKGIPRQDIPAEVDRMIADVGLEDKRNQQTMSLSGGMKRKLSIALALLGDAKTVILDEPTAGVDPYARRGIWDLLLKYKQGRTIILSTHHMDEADILGDRIAIITNGRLVTCGSSLFLKGKFGHGCDLSVAHQNLGHSKQNLTSMVEQHFAAAQLKKATDKELFFSLPRGEPARMADLLADFETNKEELGVTNFAVSDTTMEDIFLTVNSLASSKAEFRTKNIVERLWERLTRRQSHAILQPDPDDGEIGFDDVYADMTEEDEVLTEKHSHPEIETVGGIALRLLQLKALIYKRFHNFRRNIRGAITEIVVPILLIALVTLLIKLGQTGSAAAEDDPLVLTPWIYGSKADPNIIFFGDHSNPMDPASGALSQTYAPPGPGVRCMNGKPLGGGFGCTARAKQWSSSGGPVEVNRSACSCYDTGMHCPQPYTPLPPSLALETTDLAINLSGHSIADYITMTVNDEKRSLWSRKMGGFSLGEENKHALTDEQAEKAWTALRGLGTALDSVLAKLEIPWPTYTPLNGSEQDALLILKGFDTKHTVKVWYNNIGYVTVPAYTNTLNNAILRHSLPGSTTAADYGIEVTSQPLALTHNQQARLVSQKFVVTHFLVDYQFTGALLTILLVPLIVLLSYSIIPASFVIFTIEERVSQAKHLQLVSGVSPAIYWLSNFLWDILNFLAPILLTLLVFVIFNVEIFIKDWNTVIALFVLLFVYSIATVALMYPLTFVFKVPSFAVVVLAIGNFFAGFILFGFYSVRYMSSEMEGGTADATVDKDPLIRFLYSMFPALSLFVGLYTFGQRGAVDTFLPDDFEGIDEMRKNALPGYFEWHVLGRHFVAMLVTTILALILLIVIEYRNRVIVLCRRRKTEAVFDDMHDDNDVVAERNLVLSDDSTEFAVKFKRLTKVYSKRSCFILPQPSGRTLAVDRLCAAVRTGECFGLVGMNGAGKTTTFKMLTGEEIMNGGDATCNGFSVIGQMNKAHRGMGYCPQFDALNAYLTAREHLAMYARLRGAKEAFVKDVVDWGVEHMNLTAHQRVISKSYSGGNKRKLSTAIALVGKPKTILLDEPSAGMDPKARRFLWNRILEVVNEGRSVILTTHSMEECDALCDRLAIMVTGRLRCLGTTQHLKNKFNEGYKVSMQLKSRDAEAMAAAAASVTARLPRASVTDEHGNLLELQVAVDEHFPLSQLFYQVDALRGELHFVDYSVCQTSLDDVFVRFARQNAQFVPQQQQLPVVQQQVSIAPPPPYSGNTMQSFDRVAV